MTRPPGASLAQFFPTAPRPARDRATERERAKMRAQESSSSFNHVVDANGPQHPSISSKSHPSDDGSVPAFSSRPRPNTSLAEAAHLPADDTESLAGDTLNGVGSASSHDSAGSSVFSAQRNAMASVRNSNNHLTPLSNIESPPAFHSHPPSALAAKARSTTPQHVNGLDGPIPNPDGFERVPARDPSRSIKCITSTFDTRDKKRAKPIYKEFGLVCKPNNNLVLRGGCHLCCESFG